MWAPKKMWLCKGIIWHLVCSFCRWAGGIWELWESLRRKPLTWTRWLQKGCFSWISILPAPSALPVSKVQFGPCKHEELSPLRGLGCLPASDMDSQPNQWLPSGQRLDLLLWSCILLPFYSCLDWKNRQFSVCTKHWLSDQPNWRIFRPFQFGIPAPLWAFFHLSHFGLNKAGSELFLDIFGLILLALVRLSCKERQQFVSCFWPWCLTRLLGQGQEIKGTFGPGRGRYFSPCCFFSEVVSHFAFFFFPFKPD